MAILRGAVQSSQSSAEALAPLGREYRERLPLSNLPLLSTASLGGGGGGKVRINVEESVDGKVVSSRKREI